VGGLRGYPIHPLAIRTVTEVTYQPSDAQLGRETADELSVSRSQMIQQRNRNLPLRGVDKTKMDKQDVDALEESVIQGIIPVNGPPNQIIQAISAASFPREDFSFNDYITQDLDKTWGLGSNAQGVAERTTRSATELSYIQQSTQTRLAKERSKVLAWFVGGVEKLAALIQLFAGDEEYVPIIGPDGNQVIQQWSRSNIQGQFAFSVKPDSSVRQDASEQRDQQLRALNLVSNDPHAAQLRLHLLKLLAAGYGLDPTEIVDQLPPAGPDKPKVTITLTGADFSNPTVQQVLQQDYGVTIDQAAAAQTQHLQNQGLLDTKGRPTRPPSPGQIAAHGGAVRKPPPLSKHEADQTGNLPGPGPAVHVA
jgi:hypothetical protein